jgi:hypothetical protein
MHTLHYAWITTRIAVPVRCAFMRTTTSATPPAVIHMVGAHECTPYNIPGSPPASRCHDENGQSFGCSTNPCFTGLIQQYRTHAVNASSSRMWCSQNRRCHNPRSRRRMWLARLFSTGTPCVNRALITLHRVEKSWSRSGNVHTACMWSGNTTHASIRNGRSAFVTRTASRNASI